MSVQSSQPSPAPLDRRELDRESPVPLHFQLADSLERRIVGGGWEAGKKLPTEPELCTALGLSRTTVRQALGRLEQQGLILRQKGRGTFVADNRTRSWLLQSTEGFFQDEVERRGRSVSSTILRQDVAAPLPEWATQALELHPGSVGGALERLRAVDGRVALYVVNFLPPEFAEATTAIAGGDDSLYARLREMYGIEVAGGRRTVEAVPAGDRLGALLGVEAGAALAFVESRSWDRDQRPFDCYRAWLRTDRMKIDLTVSAGNAL